MGKIKHMKRNKPKKFLIIYDCDSFDIPSAEIIASDTVRHVFMRLPEKKVVTIEYYNESTGRIMSKNEYYEKEFCAYRRMVEIMNALGCATDYYNKNDSLVTKNEFISRKD